MFYNNIYSFRIHLFTEKNWFIWEKMDFTGEKKQLKTAKHIWCLSVLSYFSVLHFNSLSRLVHFWADQKLINLYVYEYQTLDENRWREKHLYETKKKSSS